MNIEDWKKSSEGERNSILQNHEKFNPYTDEAYDLVRSLGKELAKSKNFDLNKVGVLNRFGELIIHIHVPDEEKGVFPGRPIPEYFGFRVFYSGESSWFEH
jgi:hypothetical protein